MTARPGSRALRSPRARRRGRARGRCRRVARSRARRVVRSTPSTPGFPLSAVERGRIGRRRCARSCRASSGGELGWRARDHVGAAFEHDHLVGQALGLKEQVGAHDDGATLAGHLADEVEHRVPTTRGRGPTSARRRAAARDRGAPIGPARAGSSCRWSSRRPAGRARRRCRSGRPPRRCGAGVARRRRARREYARLS